MLQRGPPEGWNEEAFGFCNREAQEAMARAVSLGNQMAKVCVPEGKETGNRELGPARQKQLTFMGQLTHATHC